jgi:hypothetical protein
MLAALQQHPAFARALRLMGCDVTVDHLGGAGTAVVVRRRLPLLGAVGTVIRGPCWLPEVPEDERAERLARLAALVEAEAPCPSLPLAGFRPVATPAHVAEIDLAATPEARRAALAPKWRHALARAGRAGLGLREEAFRGGPDHWLLAREAEQRRARRYRALPPTFASAFAEASPGAARLFAAHLDGAPVAAMLVLMHRPVATYHVGWSGPEGRAACAHHLLLAHVADGLAARGFARLDLGAVDTDAAPGLARFKIGGGAAVRALGGSWVRVPGLRRLARGREGR